jgi:Sel1 repeat
MSMLKAVQEAARFNRSHLKQADMTMFLLRNSIITSSLNKARAIRAFFSPWIKAGIIIFSLIIILFFSIYIYLLVKIYPSFLTAKNYLQQNKFVQESLQSSTLRSSSIPMLKGFWIKHDKQDFLISFKVSGKKSTKILVYLRQLKKVWMINAIIKQAGKDYQFIPFEELYIHMLTQQAYENPYAGYLLALNYPDHSKKQIYWLEKAANQGVAEAANNLAIQYDKGLGVKLDAKKAFSLYQFAAKKGDYAAMYNIGLTYYQKQNFNLAAKWFSKSIETSDKGKDTELNACAPNDLGMLHAAGKGVKQDENQAQHLLEKAGKHLIMQDNDIQTFLESQFAQREDYNQSFKEYLTDVLSAFVALQMTKSKNESENDIHAHYQEWSVASAKLMTKRIKERCWD